MNKIIILTLFFLILAGLMFFLLYNGYIWFVYPDKARFEVRGIDISHYQDPVDWNELKKNDLHFIFIKATEGDDYADNKYEDNMEQAVKNGFAAGAYHFYSFRFPGKEQAENFIRTVDLNDMKLPPVIDLEFGGNSRIRPSVSEFEKQINIYIEIIRKHYGKDPIIYTTYKFHNSYLSRIKINSGYRLWIRNILYEPGKVNGDGWLFWQYNSKGRLKGIRGAVDLDVFNGSINDFNELIN